MTQSRGASSAQPKIPSARKSRPANLTRFSTLPTELRLQIWQHALEPRIICLGNVRDGPFHLIQPCRQIALLSVNQESRYVAFHYGKYHLIPEINGSNPVYFSSTLDYLWLDPLWSGLHTFFGFGGTAPENYIDPLSHHLAMVQNLIVCANHEFNLVQPRVRFGKLLSVRNVLVGAEGFLPTRQALFRTIHDVKSYYSVVRDWRPDIVEPDVAIGCLELTEWKRPSSGREPEKRLVGIFESGADAIEFLQAKLNTRGVLAKQAMDGSIPKTRQRKLSWWERALAAGTTRLPPRDGKLRKRLRGTSTQYRR